MWHDVEQNTDEWFALRAGKVTGTGLGKIMANYPKAFGDPAKKLASVIAVEQITGQCSKESVYSNAHMLRGTEEEPIANMLYEQEYFTNVGNGGFYDNGLTGCSPDGLTARGVIEIKSAIISVHYNRIRKGGYDKTYKWQYVSELRESKKEWLDFISYCSDFPKDKRLYVFRITPDMFVEEMQQVEDRLEKFFNLVAEIKERIWKI